MKLAVFLDQIANFAAYEWRTMTKAVPAFFHAVAEFARTAPTNVWAMCAFVAAASIMVTLVTLCLWPKEETVVPDRERSGANNVWQLASRGHDARDIARRTGLSHDAVATILRASTRPRGDRTARTRQSRPSAA